MNARAAARALHFDGLYASRSYTSGDPWAWLVTPRSISFVRAAPAWALPCEYAIVVFELNVFPKAVHGACGPTQMNWKRQPVARRLFSHAALRLGCEQAISFAPICTPTHHHGELGHHAFIAPALGSWHVSKPWIPTPAPEPLLSAYVGAAADEKSTICAPTAAASRATLSLSISLPPRIECRDPSSGLGGGNHGRRGV